MNILDMNHFYSNKISFPTIMAPFDSKPIKKGANKLSAHLYNKILGSYFPFTNASKTSTSIKGAQPKTRSYGQRRKMNMFKTKNRKKIE